MRIDDGGTAVWDEVHTEVGPTPRYGFFAGQDDTSGRLIVWSGAQGTFALQPASDTWALDLRAEVPVWSLLHDGKDAPKGRRNGCAGFGPTGPTLFAFGGTSDAATSQPGLWAFDGRPGEGRWTEVAVGKGPEARSSGFGIYDPGTDQRFCGFGNSENVYVDFVQFGYGPPKVK